MYIHTIWYEVNGVEDGVKVTSVVPLSNWAIQKQLELQIPDVRVLAVQVAR